jgi:leader peptidase (prepilin peptidase)/N-methyltransferase
VTIEGILSAAAFLLGSAVGSFLNVLIYRLPREGLSPARPVRSFCPCCRNQIAWHDNLPVISWLFLKGRCRHCQSPISFRYPLVELAAAFLALFLFQAEGPDLRFLFLLYFVSCLIAIAFIDLELMIIPDSLVIPTFVLGLIGAVAAPSPALAGAGVWRILSEAGWQDRWISLAGAAAGFVLGFAVLWAVGFSYRKWRGAEGLGDGDPPLLGLIGVYLGWPAVFPVLLAAALAALLSVGILVVSGRFPGKGPLSENPVPFGPFLALAALVWLFYGSRLSDWYWRSLGG